ncbi:F-BAR and double SH3 domains protein 2-like isoform X2 [Dermatophagoides pteronyssinus]|uniref:F-BAR and double SH3 domains protein 2-like isoform X2 n=1 Tax=Dermatophagoides pteronyssinus TaxID=6956 RepID=UPI003F670540
MSAISSSPSPSPTPPPPPPQSSSPSHHQHSTKPGALVSSAKSLLSEQSTRLLLKHTTDLDLLDDLRNYLKNRCALERDYAQSLAKLNTSYAKRTSTFLTFVTNEDENSDIKTLYTSWRIYQEEMEKHAKNRQSQFEQLATVCETLKTLRSHKIQIAKKCLDNYLKKMHEEIVHSVNEIDKTRKLYFEEEHLAKQARDKEEKIKKRKTGIFASFTSLQNKKERTSAHREASDIQSTQARNDYIMALAAGNAHFDHYYNQDLINLMLNIDDCVLDKCRSHMLNLLKVEKDSVQSWSDVIEKATDLVDHTSADYTNSIFLRDPNSSSLTEILTYEFQSCDNDSIETISLDHNADIALRNEGQKWFTWFSKECRNLNRLSAQLVKLQALLSEGHKTVDLPGSGQVEIENRIDEIRQQLRKCEISKLKAKARLQVIKESGAEVEDFIAFESQVTNEIKQQSLEVDNLNLTSLSRTPSMRSHSDLEAKLSKSETENIGHQTVRPESSSSIEQLDSPDRELLQMGTSIESTSPAPTSAAYSAVNQTSWGDYDPAQAWDNESSVLPTSTNATTVGNAYNGINDDYQQQQQTIDEYRQHSNDLNDDQMNNDNYQQQQQNIQENFYEDLQQQQQHDHLMVDGFSLIGKQCFVLYSYTGQNDDELTIVEQEIIDVVNAADKDWVQAQNKDGHFGYVPASYLQPVSMNEHYEATSDMPNDISTFNDANNEQQQYQITSANDQWTTDEPPAPPISSLTQQQTEMSAPEINIQQASSTCSPNKDKQQHSEQSNEQMKDNDDNKHSDETFVRALYDYIATNSEEISFKSGDLIKIIDQESDDGWWTGQTTDGHIGHFPSMLVSELEESDDEDEENDDNDDDNDADDDDDDNDNGPGGLANQIPLPPPSIDLPPPVLPPMVEIDSCNKNGTTATDIEFEGKPSLPPLPPPPPPQIVACDGDDETTLSSLPPLPPPPPPPSRTEPIEPPTFAPPPKPVQLMTPQAVVIIQPTPEIESRPVIGSDSQNDNFAYQKDIDHQQSNIDGNKSMEQKNEPPSVCVSMAIAAHEISETITQQAIDDSLRELERRSSAASSNQDPPTTTTVSRSSIDVNCTSTHMNGMIVVTNGEISHDDDNNDIDDDVDVDEDMK